MTTSPKDTVITYAIGGINGLNQLLVSLLRELEQDAKDRGAVARFVFLGNLIGIGPDARGVFDTVAKAVERNPGSVLILGEADNLFLKVLDKAATPVEMGKAWLRGMGCALASYPQWAHMDTDPDDEERGEWDDVNQMADHIRAVYPDHVELLRKAVPVFQTNGYCFVHAGIRPGVAIADQTLEDLTEIEDDFLIFDGSFEAMVVHGHSPTPSDLPEVHSNRISLDTEAHSSTRLNAAAFEPGQLTRFISAFGGGVTTATCHCGDPVIERRTWEQSKFENIQASGIAMITPDERTIGPRIINPLAA